MSADLITNIEWFAAIAGLINVFLLTRQTIWAWPAGLLSVFLYAFVFYHNRLYSDVVLHVIYVILNVFGWYTWSQKTITSESNNLKISTLEYKEIVIWSSSIIVSFILWGSILKQNSKAHYAYADAFILTASLVAQYFLAIKKLENWIIWIIIDLVAITIYYLKGLYVTSALYVIYLCLCILGYNQWRKVYALIK